MDNKRMSRVDGEIQKSLAEIISRFDDSVISTSLISIMKVETFSDLSMSRIYVSVFGNEEKKKQEQIIAKIRYIHKVMQQSPLQKTIKQKNMYAQENITTIKVILIPMKKLTIFRK